MSMPEPKPASPRKALDYAEKELGVHTSHEEAKAAHEKFNQAQADVLAARESKRLIEDSITSREMDLVVDEAAKHPSMSVAAMERHLKVVLHTDESLTSLRADLRNQAFNLDLAESRVRSAEVEVRIAVARLNELGGYFAYLAAIKSAQKA